MNFLEFAKELETEGIRFYTDLAEKMSQPELSSIFNFLAQEEKRHYAIFDAWKNNRTPPELAKENQTFSEDETIKKLLEPVKSIDTSILNRDDALTRALILEEKTILFYDDACDEMTDPEQKVLLKSIIAQEEKHRMLIQSIMDFQRHPFEWLENAEWNHHEVY